MVDMRDYKIVIRDAVKRESENDKNWNWKVARVNKGSISIRWGYLDFVGEDWNFTILVSEDGDGDIVLTGYFPHDETMRDSLFVWVGPDHWHDCKTLDDVIRLIVHAVARRAHDLY